ncbi:MAG: YicC family protein [Planctomycetes bacterium RBG_16_64_10]|nr:MAG: YicC family protein [Planctomycetes bacterium RBG_16_64_10]
MLLSMTGFGEAYRQTEGVGVAVEVRTINSRYFKLVVRGPEGYAALEPRIEDVIRRTIRRGTIQVQFRVDEAQSPDDFHINGRVLAGYRAQLEAVARDWGNAEPVRMDTLLGLPGVVQDRSDARIDKGQQWPLIQATLDEALNALTRMRSEEGAAMAADLSANCQMVADRLERIEALAPAVVDAYRQRLSERVSKALETFQVSADPGDLIREVSLFAERSDISEEIVRLRSHVRQFEEIMAQADSAGRKLEFLTQEMFRESNTIGAKANDVAIIRHVVDIKTAIERIREQVQNVE